jgi:hypothetical protein
MGIIKLQGARSKTKYIYREQCEINLRQFISEFGLLNRRDLFLIISIMEIISPL